MRGRPLATERATRALVFKSLVRAWCRGLRVPVLSALQRLQDQGAWFIRDWLSGSVAILRSVLSIHIRSCLQADFGIFGRMAGRAGTAGSATKAQRIQTLGKLRGEEKKSLRISSCQTSTLLSHQYRDRAGRTTGVRQPSWIAPGPAGSMMPGRGRNGRCSQREGDRFRFLKEWNVFELSLPLKPHVWSGNFPLVYAFLSLLRCYRIIWFLAGSEGKISASCREGCYWDILLSRKNNLLILFSTTSKEHEKSRGTRLFSTKTSCSISKAEESG